MNYWLVKTEPGTYSWDDFVKKGRDHWDGVRNYKARNNLKKMKENDRVFFYHSVTEKAIIGIARVVREHYPDPTSDDPQWVVVDLEPERKLTNPVTLKQIKADERLKDMRLVRNSRLSVMEVEKQHADVILKLSGE